MPRTVVLTGASSGIGAHAALELSRRGDDVVMVGRNPGKLADAAARVTAETGRTPRRHVCDFASFAAVRALGTELAAEYPVLDVLVNNAGLITAARRTEDGHDLTIQANHLSPFLLTGLLLPSIRNADAGRIVTTSSAAHTRGRLDPDDLDFERRRFTKWRAYSDSKQANILFTVELAWRLRETGVVATCFHPGVVRTDFGEDQGLFRLLKRVSPIGFVSPSQGATTLVDLAATDLGRGISGAYFSDRRPARATSRAVDPELAGRLWAVSEQLTS